MLVMKIDKELSTKELIAYGKELSEHLGEKVVILDNKVKEFYRLDKKEYLLPVYPYTPYDPYPHWTCTDYPYVLCHDTTSITDCADATTNDGGITSFGHECMDLYILK